MPSLINYKGLQILTPNPSGNGGLAIQDDFKALVDWHAKSNWTATSDPGSGNDQTQDYYAGSLWLNTSSNQLFLCRSSSTGAAVWQLLPFQIAGNSPPRLPSDLDVNGFAFVSHSDGDITLSPNGTGQVVLDGLTWPAADGSANHVLVTDGAGALSFAVVPAAGSTTQVQYNSSGAMAGDADFTFDPATNTLLITGVLQADNLQLDGNTLSSTDTDGDITLAPNGTGQVVLDGLTWPAADGSANHVLVTDGAGALSFAAVPAAGSTTQVQFNSSGSLAGDADFTFDSGTNTLAVTGVLQVDNLELNGNTLSSTDTDGPVIVSPDGDGALQLDAAGNARGSQAVDLQSSRSGSSQVASGARAAILGGTDNTASGDDAQASGSGTVASGAAAQSGGLSAKAHLRGQWSRGSGGHSGAVGTAQSSILTLFRQTSDSTATELTLGGGSPAAGTRFTILDGQTVACLILIVGREIDGGSTAHACFIRQVLIRREGSTTSLVGSVQTVGTDINPSGWGGVTITADDTNESLKIEVSGAASTNIRWTATAYTSETADEAI